MLVEFALFDKDTLLQRGSARVTEEAQCVHLETFNVAHQLVGNAAKLVLSSFAPSIPLKTASLDIPVHQSDDWESIEFANHTLAFRCSLDS